MKKVQVQISWNVDDHHDFSVVVDTRSTYSSLAAPACYAAMAVKYFIQHLALVGIDYRDVKFQLGSMFYRDSPTGPMHIVG